MSAKRRRAKADRNRKAFPLTSAVLNNDWITSGRAACSYGVHDGNPCLRCGAEYLREKLTMSDDSVYEPELRLVVCANCKSSFVVGEEWCDLTNPPTLCVSCEEDNGSLSPSREGR